MLEDIDERPRRLAYLKVKIIEQTLPIIFFERITEFSHPLRLGGLQELEEFVWIHRKATIVVFSITWLKAVFYKALNDERLIILFR